MAVVETDRRVSVAVEFVHPCLAKRATVVAASPETPAPLATIRRVLERVGSGSVRGTVSNVDARSTDEPPTDTSGRTGRVGSGDVAGVVGPVVVVVVVRGVRTSVVNGSDGSGRTTSWLGVRGLPAIPTPANTPITATATKCGHSRRLMIPKLAAVGFCRPGFI